MSITSEKRVAVLGAGTMGTGLAALFSMYGYSVALYSIPDPTVDRAPALIRAALQSVSEAGSFPASEIDGMMARIRITTSLEEAVAGAFMMLETIVEKSEVKKALYEDLDALCPPEVIFASNTSYLNIFPLVPARRQPYTAITHFFTPAHIMPLVEIVKGPETAEETIRKLMNLYEAMKRIPVRLERFVPGFCVNRLLRDLSESACYLVDGGVITPQELDKAVKASIIPRAMVLGVMQRYDFTGMDLSYNNLNNQAYDGIPKGYKPQCVIDHAVKGEYGVKTGKGFYDYSDRKMEDVFKARDKAILRILSFMGDDLGKPI